MIWVFKRTDVRNNCIKGKNLLKSRKNRASFKLSDRQKKILRYIERTNTETGYPPTIREIGEAVGIGSTSVVNYNLNKLEQAGYIERERNVSRGLRLLRTLNDEPFEALGVHLVEDETNVVKVPMVGEIVAGEPVGLPPSNDFEFIDDDDMLHVPTYLLGKHNSTGRIFALRVKGQSMIDALVNDRDIVVLQQQDTANNGDMVAVWLAENNQTTLKYFFNEGEKVRLQPANSMMQPIYVNANDVHIQGRVLAVLRQI